MRIANFRVQKYRSIEKSESIDLTTLTVLVGPNNEGKSNILRALVVGLEALGAISTSSRTIRPRSAVLQQRLDNFESYHWARDFPMQLQEGTPGAYSLFEFEFTLDPSEVAAFKDEIGHALNGELKLRVLIGNNGKAQFRVVKRGPGSSGLNAKLAAIAHFVTSRIRVEYIPVARTFDQSQMVVRREASSVLKNVAASSEYQAAALVLNNLVAEALGPLEERLLEGVREFIPDVNRVSIRTNVVPTRFGLPDVQIDIDDGRLTNLSAKGDGVQSLVAISLVRMLARRSPDVTYVLAVEEPEAHLHPGAVHKLREVLNEIAERDQVILTTHNSILVRRDDASSNILVNNNAAEPARSLRAVRDSLGIRLPDNMTSSEVVLLVEGKHDRELISHVIRGESRELNQALNEGRLEIHDVDGATNTSYQYRLFRDSVCALHVLLDDDAQGRRARTELDKMDGISPADITMITANEMNESELEDLFDAGSYADMFKALYNVTLDPSATQTEKRFSLRMKDQFGASGQPWNDSIESNVKIEVAKAIMAQPSVPLLPERRGVITALVTALKRKLQIEVLDDTVANFGD